MGVKNVDCRGNTIQFPNWFNKPLNPDPTLSRNTPSCVKGNSNGLSFRAAPKCATTLWILLSSSLVLNLQAMISTILIRKYRCVCILNQLNFKTVLFSTFYYHKDTRYILL